ncbi:MAG: hypothetical protein JJV95_04870 [Sulfurospirillum sp.]|nr:hypothetical protein [Sulfurospirillum sp.]
MSRKKDQTCSAAQKTKIVPELLKEEETTAQTATKYKRILKDCFWDYAFSVDAIIKLSSGEKREKSFLFQKILLNSTSLFNALKIFKDDDLKSLIEDYNVPTFNHAYIFKRKNMAEAYFLNKPITINELKWVV